MRVADPTWEDPLDPAFAAERGGRWNPPASYPALYLNADFATARLQIDRLLRDTPVRPDDLDDDAFVLVAAVLPRRQDVADAVSASGLRALGIPPSYPEDAGGDPVGVEVCQPIGAGVRKLGLRGVWCRSAASSDAGGRELAWFPATRRSRARPVWDAPLPLGQWRGAEGWADLGLLVPRDPQAGPK